MDITFRIGDTEVSDSAICMLGGIWKMVQLTGANLSKVVWLKTTERFANDKGTMDITFRIGDMEVSDSAICMLGGIWKMVQLTGANLSKVVWHKTTVDLEVFELG